MKSMSLVFVVAIIAFITYQLGLLERPEFIHSRSFLGGQEMHAIVATTTERNIGMHVGRLIEGTQKGMAALGEKGKTMLQAAAKAYDLDESISSVSMGIYFDDPYAEEHPRWAIGWAVVGPTMEELQDLVPTVQEASGINDHVKVVRIGGRDVQTFSARIPWRNYFTPMFAPMLNWGRGFGAYEEYIKQHKDEDKGIAPIALEVYVCDEEHNKKQFIDYTLLFGEVANTWDDCFPGSSGKEEDNKDDMKQPAVDPEQLEDTAATE